LNINHIFKQLILDYFDLHVEIIEDYLKDEKFSNSDTKLFYFRSGRWSISDLTKKCY